MIRNKDIVNLPRLAAEDRYTNYKPRTEFGRRMLELRRAIEDSGEKMLTSEQVNEEVRLRRGGAD